MMLSVIDLGWPGSVLRLAPALAAAGYQRLWATEHYTPVQSASPTVMVAAAGVASLGTGMRVGTAGVLLNFRSPHHVAAEAKLLEVLFPGRVDIGVSSSTAGGGALAKQLGDGRPPPSRVSYASKVAELSRLIRQDTGDGESESCQADLGPQSASAPQMWVCGTSLHSAELAGRLGLSFSFHDDLCPSTADGVAIVRRYVDSFEPGAHTDQPRYNVAVYGLAAASEKRALRLLGGRQVRYWGRPEQCAEQLREVAALYGTDELVTYALTSDGQDQLQSYLLMADEFGLS